MTNMMYAPDDPSSGWPGPSDDNDDNEIIMTISAQWTYSEWLLKRRQQFWFFATNSPVIRVRFVIIMMMMMIGLMIFKGSCNVQLLEADFLPKVKTNAMLDWRQN